MDEVTIMGIAAQLRKPHGEWAENTGEFMNKGNELLNRRAIEELNVTDGDVVLEIGMGNGYFAGDIISQADNVTYFGCDYSQEMVDASNRKNVEHIVSGKATFVCGNADTMPFDDNTFDKILTANTIYFWDDVAKTFSEIKRVLKASGKLVIAVRPEALMKTYPMTKYGFTTYTAERLQKLITDNGFEVINVREEEEPAQEMNGQELKLASLIVSAINNGD